MQRSTIQTLYRYLPNAVFPHEDGFTAQVYRVNGPRVSEINDKLLLEEIAEELGRWRPDQVGIPNPRTSASEFVVLEPQEVVWDVFPLTFACTRPGCQRVRRWFRQDQLLADTASDGRVSCEKCSAPMRQLRYVTAHECGNMTPLYTPTCKGCGSTADVYLDDVGSFRSSSWRCRNCGWSQGTRFTPCNCGLYSRGTAAPYMQGFTARDQRLWYPQTVTIINISGQTYDNVQAHPHRGVAALASWLGDEADLAATLTELDRPGGGQRMTASEWADQEQRLRDAGVDQVLIDDMRARNAPATTGPAAITATASAEVIAAAGTRSMVERAGLFDARIVQDRKSFAAVRNEATGAERRAADNTASIMASLGIADISVTQTFPIVVASYGYSRRLREPGKSHLRSYAKPKMYKGKTPIFAVPADTEALLVTLSAHTVLGFLATEGLYARAVPVGERDAKLELASLLAVDQDTGGDGPGGVTRRLVHSASHALLRALDDGQSGFGESSLAEWIVADALTSAIYVASYNDFTLGALDTVLRRRITPWLLRTVDDVDHCDNDPMCSHVSSVRPHAACDRCLHLSFGCKSWNADLDRRLLRRFWLWTQLNAATGP